MRSQPFTIEQRIDNARDFTGDEPMWISGGTVYAKLETLAGRELTDARQVYESVSHRLTTRYRRDLEEPTFRLRSPDDRVLHIEAAYRDNKQPQNMILLANENA